MDDYHRNNEWNKLDIKIILVYDSVQIKLNRENKYTATELKILVIF